MVPGEIKSQITGAVKRTGLCCVGTKGVSKRGMNQVGCRVRSRPFVTGHGIHNGRDALSHTNLTLGNSHGVTDEAGNRLLNIRDNSPETRAF
ncbi:unannotated protein [freshwater metagenome]|uniref:Unannotated protein n=1 Tax=freshwater metagenome TaxID=449393 RepID=A0A6J6JPW8_9ZZZZ